MFTGIVEETGSIKSITGGSNSGVVRILCQKILSDLKIGDSVAVNGVCLTVSQKDRNGFSADVMPETIRRSGLGQLKTGSAVNLERAMAADGRFGGHIVSGHIDGTGKIRSLRKEENALWMEVECSPELMELIVEKGSICIDGISLTVAKTAKDSFSVSLIPHTASITTMKKRKRGDLVNLETDIIGKYVKKLMSVQASQPSSESQNNAISMQFLAENGF